MPGAIGDASRIDLNSAGQEQLEQVGGLGRERARRIIQARPLNSWDDVPEDRKENQSQSGNQSSQGEPTSNTQNLKEREYRGSEANIHHHTHTAEEMKEKKDKAA